VSGVIPSWVAGSEPVTVTLSDSIAPFDTLVDSAKFVVTPLVGKTIVIDPWTKAPAGWLPKADLVLLTDNHPDHYDPKGIETVRKEGTVFIAPEVVAEKLPEAKVLNNGEELTEAGIRIAATPMYNHKRGPEPGKLFHDKGRGNGYLMTFGDKRIYLSGDTACTDEMRVLEKVDVALICMNLPYTMPPEEAAECVKAFKPRVAIPFHYRGSDTKVFAKALEGVEGVEVRLRDFYAEP
jgi:L-ascorbate metabolism protein UlaG (beta-lactamase superfamily)